MKMKTWIAAVMAMAWLPNAAMAEEQMHHHSGGGHHAAMAGDERIPLGLDAAAKRHQLANMRAHLEAVESIIKALGAEQFDEAAATARKRLGLTPQMQQMCNAFANAEFREAGFAFHRQADAMAGEFESRDLQRSLAALSRTMQHCTSCHTQFRQ